MKINAKVVKIKRKNFTAIRCSVVRNFRCPSSGRPRNILYIMMPTFKSVDLVDDRKVNSWWSLAEANLAALKAKEKWITAVEIEKVRYKFGLSIPKPIVRVPQVVKKKPQFKLAEKYIILDG